MKLFFKIFTIIFFLAASKGEASSLYFDPNSIEKDKGLDFSVDLMIDTEGKIINTIGGEIKIPSDLDVKNITYGNSIIAFWVDRPILENGKIIFSGIIPGGFKGKLRSGGLSPGKILTLNLNSRNEEKK